VARPPFTIQGKDACPAFQAGGWRFVPPIGGAELKNSG
jgi:hypothetical protein